MATTRHTEHSKGGTFYGAFLAGDETELETYERKKITQLRKARERETADEKMGT